MSSPAVAAPLTPTAEAARAVGITEYQMTHQLILGAHQTLSLLPIREILAAQQTAHAIGPILDPTLYRDKVKAMDEDRKLFEAAQAFVGAIDAAIAKAEAR